MIQELIEELVAPVAVGPLDNPNGDGQVIAVRSNYKIEKLDGKRKNARTHVFDDLRSLADWMNRHAVEPAASVESGVTGKQSVEILVSEREVCALIAPSDVGGDRVTCPLRSHPLFTMWESAFGKPMNQKAFYSFIRSVVGSFDGDAGDMLAGQLVKLKAAGGQDVDLEIDELGFSKLAAQSTTMTFSAKLPPRFQIIVPVIDGVCEPQPVITEKRYVIDVFLEVDVVKAGGQGMGEKLVPMFAVTAPMLPLVKHQARIDAAVYLESLLKPGFLVGLGTIGTKEVPA